jgi:serine/threonine protein kinase
VLDFGIVRTAEEATDPSAVVSLDPPTPSPSSKLTQHGLVVGTPGYIAPEQLVQQPIDARSDLYALGCVAWWLLAGAELFRRATEKDQLEAHVKEPPPRLRDHVRGWLPDELDGLVASLLAKRPEDRPSDARALARELRAIAIPAEHAWTDARAQAWWLAHRPSPAGFAIAKPHDETSVERLVVPRISDPPPVPNPTDAQTLADRPR